jgi:uncharacterized membrane protein YiaA
MVARRGVPVPFSIFHSPFSPFIGPRIATHAHAMSSFATYVFGFVILILGLAIAAYLLDVPSMWIAVGVIVALGIGVITATSRTKMKDPPGTS